MAVTKGDRRTEILGGQKHGGASAGLKRATLVYGVGSAPACESTSSCAYLPCHAARGGLWARVSASGEGNIGAGRKNAPCAICGVRHSKAGFSRTGGAMTVTCFLNRSFFGFLAASFGKLRGGFGRFRCEPLRVPRQPLPLLSASSVAMSM